MARRVHGLLGGSVSLEPSCESGSLERTCASSPTRQPPTLAREAAVVSRAKQPPILLLLLLLLLPLHSSPLAPPTIEFTASNGGIVDHTSASAR